MADATIEILLQATDAFSTELNKFKSTIEGTATNVQQQAAKVDTSWQNNLQTLVALGNTASSVDNIFSSYQALQIRIENAELRVTEAREANQRALGKVKESQIDLNIAIRTYGKNSSEAQKAQLKLNNELNTYDNSIANVTRSQNLLKRVQNQVLGTYINIGTQIANLVVSIPILVARMAAQITATWAQVSANAALAISWGIVGAAIAVVAGVAIYAYIQSIKDATDETLSMIPNAYDGAEAIDAIGDSASESERKLKSFKSVLEAMFFGKEELEADKELILIKNELANKEIERAEFLRKNEGKFGFKPEESRDLAKIDAEIEAINTRIDNRRREVEAYQQLATNTEEWNVENETSKTKLFEVTAQMRAMMETAEGMDQVVGLINSVARALETTKTNAFNATEQVGTLTTTLNGVPKDIYTTIHITEERTLGKDILASFGFDPYGERPKKKKDFIITPQGMIQTDPQDYIIGTKNPQGMGGMTINIYGDNYGVNAEAIARELQRKINRQILT